METNDFRTRSVIENRQFKSTEKYWPIGLDIGYSAVKGISPNKNFCFPAYARPVSDDFETMRAPERSDIIYRSDNGKWVVGALAYDTGEASDAPDSISDLYARDRYSKPIFKVLVEVGMALGIMGNRFGEVGNKRVLYQTGLPPRFLKGDERPLKKAMTGHHCFELKVGSSEWMKFEFDVNADDVFVIAQPLGSLVCASIDANGHTTKDAKNFFRSNLLVFDPGFGTTDLYTLNKGVVVPDKMDTFPDVGMREVFNRTCDDIRELYGVDMTIPELQNKLEQGTIYVSDEDSLGRKKVDFGPILEKNCKEVCKKAFEKMASNTSRFRDTEYIIMTGGTSEAWKTELKNMLGNMDGLELIPANRNDTTLSNIFSNARGYYFHCIGQSRNL